MTAAEREKTSGEHFSHETSRIYADGEKIFAEGDSGRDLYIIQRGAVEIRKRSGGIDLVLTRFSRGDFFGELSLLHSVPRSATAVAVGETSLLVLQPGGFLLKIRRDPTFAFEMIQQLSHRIKVANDRLVGVLGKIPLPDAELLQLLKDAEGPAK
jgi:CRP-like cAMP-binding protein